jgi:hypothetical protein
MTVLEALSCSTPLFNKVLLEPLQVQPLSVQRHTHWLSGRALGAAYSEPITEDARATERRSVRAAERGIAEQRGVRATARQRRQGGRV